MQDHNRHRGAAQIAKHGADAGQGGRQAGGAAHQHPASHAGQQQKRRVGIAVARQPDRAEPPQHQQQNKGRCASRRPVQRAHLRPRGAAQHRAKVEHPVAAGRNAQPPDIPADLITVPADPEQHAGKQPLRDQRITAVQQPLQQSLDDSVQ